MRWCNTKHLNIYIYIFHSMIACHCIYPFSSVYITCIMSVNSMYASVIYCIVLANVK